MVKRTRTYEQVNHILTLDTAKEIAMIQRSEPGKRARQYFIQVEKAWNSPEMIMQRALKIANSTINQLETQIEKDKPKVIFADAVATTKTSILVGELAKIIKQNGVNIGQRRLFEWLRQNGFLIKRQGVDYNMPTQYSMERELFEIKKHRSHIQMVIHLLARHQKLQVKDNNTLSINFYQSRRKWYE